MLYVAIDQHAKQITVAIRNDQGEDVLKRQVQASLSANDAADFAERYSPRNDLIQPLASTRYSKVNELKRALPRCAT